MEPITIRGAYAPDVSAILALMQELAEFQGIAHRFKPDPARLKLQLSIRNPKLFGFLALAREEVVGYCLLYHTNYSSFQSRWQALKLEDLYVKESARGAGVGLRLMKRVAQEVAEQGVDELIFDIHQDNADAHRWYAQLGALNPKQTDWVQKRLTQKHLSRLFLE
jgi:ribosomal protein S18 acetylase RimI-like enzyme